MPVTCRGAGPPECVTCLSKYLRICTMYHEPVRVDHFVGKEQRMVRHQLLVRWLEEAYGMESSLFDLLSSQLADFTEHPEWEKVVSSYLDRALAHTTQLQDYVARLGGETSSLQKGGMSGFLAGTVRPATPPEHGAQVKDVLRIIAAQHFKMAAYVAIIAGANQIGEQQSAHVCATILKEEREFAGSVQELLARRPRLPFSSSLLFTPSVAGWGLLLACSGGEHPVLRP